MKDYKEKYEQALDNLKKIKDANKDNKELVDFIEYKYPELKESEDEIVMAEIIAFIEQSIHRGGGTPIPQEQENRWLAWLEKQSEQKPASKLQVSEKLYEHIRNTCACISDALSSKTLVDVNDYLEQADADAQSAFDMIEQGEQKPAWSEEDESNFNSAIYYIRREPYRECDVEPIVDWLKTLKEKYTWKPSEEQMTALRKMKAAIAGEGEIYKPLNLLYQELEKLRSHEIH